MQQLDEREGAGPRDAATARAPAAECRPTARAWPGRRRDRRHQPGDDRHRPHRADRHVRLPRRRRPRDRYCRAARLHAAAERRPPPRPRPTCPMAQMVQRFDSYLYRHAARPSRARRRRKSIRLSRVLPSLKQTLERIDELDPDAQDARRLMSIHLPGLIDRYVTRSGRLPQPAGRRRQDRRRAAGRSASRRAAARSGRFREARPRRPRRARDPGRVHPVRATATILLESPVQRIRPARGLTDHPARAASRSFFIAKVGQDFAGCARRAPAAAGRIGAFAVEPRPASRPAELLRCVRTITRCCAWTSRERLGRRC